MKRFLSLFLSLFAFAIFAFIFLKKCNQKQSIGTAATTAKEYLQDTSTLLIPVRMDIASFEPIFNKQMDNQGWFYEENGIEVNRNLSLSFRVKKEGHAQLYPQHGNIHLQIPLLIDIHPRVSGPLSLGIGRNMNLQARVTLKSAIEADIDSNWELLTDAKTTFDIEEAPELNIAGIKINFKKQLAQNLDLGVEEINQQIETQVKEAINTREIIELIWDEIKTPYHIKSEPFDLWAMITPEQVYASDLKPGGPGILETTFKVNGLVEITTGSRPLRVNSKRIPEAIRVNQFETKQSGLNFPLVIPFETLTGYLNQLKEPLSFPIQGNRTLTLSNFSAKNKEHNIHLMANFFSGDTEGELTLIGQPMFDPNNQTISVKIKAIKTESNSKMVDQLIHSLQKNKSFKRNIENQMSYSIKQDLADLTFEVTNQLKSTELHDYATIDGYLNQIKVNDIYSKNEQLLIDTTIDLQMNCSVAAAN